MRFVVAVERDATDPTLWRYGQAGPDGELQGDVRRWRYHPDTGIGEPVDPPGPDLATAVLLVRQAAGRTRVIWDVSSHMFPDAESGPPPSPPRAGGRWVRATAGKAKAAGETLAQKATRAHGARLRAA